MQFLDHLCQHVRRLHHLDFGVNVLVCNDWLCRHRKGACLRRGRQKRVDAIPIDQDLRFAVVTGKDEGSKHSGHYGRSQTSDD